MSEKVIHLMTWKLKPIKERLYYMSFPSNVKQKLLELEKESNRQWKSTYKALPFEGTLYKMLRNYLCISTFGKVIDGNEDSHWITSLEEVSPSLVCRVVQIWIQTFYIDEIQLAHKRKNSALVKQKAQEILDSLKPEDFITSADQNTSVLVDDNGCLGSSLGYTLIPGMVTEYLNGKKLGMEGGEYTVVRCSENQLMTIPEDIDLHKGKYFASVVLTFTLQTIPSRKEVYLNLEVSRRRWVGGDNKSFSRYDKTCYIRDERRFVPIRTTYDSIGNKTVWRIDDAQWYRKRFGAEELPEYETVLKDPQASRYPAIYIPYDQSFLNTGYVKTGVTTTDRKMLYCSCGEYLEKFCQVEEISAKTVGLQGNHPSRDFFDNTFHRNPMGGFLNAVNTAVANSPLSVYVWRHPENANEEKAAGLLMEILQDHFANTGVEVSLQNLKEMADPLELQADLKIGKSPVGIRVDQIRNRVVKQEDRKVLSFIFLKGKEGFTNQTDPKNAMRLGFHLSGHLTQFLIPDDVVKQEVDRFAEKQRKEELQEEKNKRLREKGEKEVWKDIDLDMNRNIQGAVLDGYRQLGILPEYRNGARPTGEICMGIQVVPIRNLIGGKRLSPFPVVSVVDYETNRVYAYCDLFCDDLIPYDEFLLKAGEYAYESGKGRGSISTIYPNPTKLIHFLERFLQDHKVHLCFENTANTRMILENISNTAVQIGKPYKLCIKEYQNPVEVRYPEGNLLSVIRVRRSSNHEVPDYYRKLSEKNTEKKNYEYIAGVFEREGTYYSLDKSEKKDKVGAEISVVNMNKQYTHKRLLELYPLYVADNTKVWDEIYLIHDIRESMITYTSRTILPLPLEIIDEDRLHEYMIEKEKR